MQKVPGLLSPTTGSHYGPMRRRVCIEKTFLLAALEPKRCSIAQALALIFSKRTAHWYAKPNFAGCWELEGRVEIGRKNMSHQHWGQRDINNGTQARPNCSGGCESVRT